MAVCVCHDIAFLPGEGSKGTSFGFCGMSCPWFLAQITQIADNFLGEGVKRASTVIYYFLVTVACTFFAIYLYFCYLIKR